MQLTLFSKLSNFVSFAEEIVAMIKENIILYQKFKCFFILNGFVYFANELVQRSESLKKWNE